jgi:hypothetical protein
MLQAHSFLWHYLWLAPHVLQLGLAVFIWRRGLHRLFPIFLAYTIVEAIDEFTLYGLDLTSRIGPLVWWYVFLACLIIEGILKFAIVGELLFDLLRKFPAIAQVGSRLIRGTGAVLVLLATLAAAYAPIDNPQNPLLSRAHILDEGLYIVQCGLLLFLFLFAAHFELKWSRRAFGIALGFGILSCEHLGAWAIAASGALIERRELLDFVNMATYHVCVLIWGYFFMVSPRSSKNASGSLPEHNLEVWNCELERLLQ